MSVSPYDFSRVKFDGRAFFDGLQNADQVTNFSFEGATFESGLSLSATGSLHCVPDLCGTQYSHQIVLDELRCDPQKRFGCHSCDPGEFVNPEDASRLRRLKEIAEQNKDHDQSLEFKALELQGGRHHPNTGKSCFRVCSN